MKILHASDLHLDTSFHRLSAEQAGVRRRELRELPMAMARLVREEQVDLVLLPGDLFDGDRVYPETVEALATALGAMEVPVVIAPGNHDHIHAGSPYLSKHWPDNVHIFTDPYVESFEIPQLNCVVYGYAFTAPRRTDEPLKGFAVPEDGRIHLLCAHADLAMAGNYAPLPPHVLSATGVTYAALGHVHTGTGLNWEGDTAWAYCGCPEGRGFDEVGPKGVLLVRIDDAGVAARFVALSRRQYRIERVDPADFDRRAEELPNGDLVRFVLTGESRRAPDLDDLLERVRSRFFYAELRDETVLSRDIWARAEEDGLTGLFLREMRRRLESASEEERPSVLMAARFGLAALEGGEDIRL